MNIKTEIGKIIEQNKDLKASLEEVRNDKPTLRDIFSSEKLRRFMRKLAAFAVALRDIYCRDKGISEAELIDSISEYLDKKVELPFFIEPFDEILFKLLLKSLMDAVENAAEIVGTTVTARVELQKMCV